MLELLYAMDFPESALRGGQVSKPEIHVWRF